MATNTLAQAIRNLQKLKGQLTTITGGEMVGEALDNIRKQGFEGKYWRLRMATKKDRRRFGRAILADTGDGRRSIEFTATGYMVKITAFDYMVAHNEGVNKTVTVQAHSRKRFGRAKSGVFSIKTRREGTKKVVSGEIDVDAHSRKMNLPKRQFIGDTPKLRDRIIKVIANKIAAACA